jgi:hypothetical protein
MREWSWNPRVACGRGDGDLLGHGAARYGFAAAVTGRPARLDKITTVPRSVHQKLIISKGKKIEIASIDDFLPHCLSYARRKVSTSWLTP